VDTTQQTDINTVLDLVGRYARRFIHDYHDAQDLTQDVLVKVQRAYKRNPAISEWNDAQLAAWLWQITRNAAIDMLRATRRREQLTQELTDIHYVSSDIESDVEAREIIEVALSRLPERQRVLLVLDAQGYTYKEIAQREQGTRGSVASGLHRARIAIREVAA
jgi:RNA polymerase sigma-70 factor, ECF subfamily